MREVIVTCPLGSECEEIRDNKMYRCAWYTEVQGKDVNGNDTNNSKCAMAWMPILQVETSSTNRGQTQQLERLNNSVNMARIG